MLSSLLLRPSFAESSGAPARQLRGAFCPRFCHPWPSDRPPLGALGRISAARFLPNPGKVSFVATGYGNSDDLWYLVRVELPNSLLELWKKVYARLEMTVPFLRPLDLALPAVRG